MAYDPYTPPPSGLIKPYTSPSPGLIEPYTSPPSGYTWDPSTGRYVLVQDEGLSENLGNQITARSGDWVQVDGAWYHPRPTQAQQTVSTTHPAVDLTVAPTVVPSPVAPSTATGQTARSGDWVQVNGAWSGPSPTQAQTVSTTHPAVDLTVAPTVVPTPVAPSTTGDSWSQTDTRDLLAQGFDNLNVQTSSSPNEYVVGSGLGEQAEAKRSDDWTGQTARAVTEGALSALPFAAQMASFAIPTAGKKYAKERLEELRASKKEGYPLSSEQQAVFDKQRAAIAGQNAAQIQANLAAQTTMGDRSAADIQAVTGQGTATIAAANADLAAREAQARAVAAEALRLEEEGIVAYLDAGQRQALGYGPRALAGMGPIAGQIFESQGVASPGSGMDSEFMEMWNDMSPEDQEAFQKLAQTFA